MAHEEPRSSEPFERSIVYQAIRDVSPRRTYLEIGSSSGGSFASFGTLMEPGATLISVDLAMPTQNGERNRRTLEGVIASLGSAGFLAYLVDGDSTDIATRGDVSGLLCGGLVDVLLIDGGHTGAVVFQDVQHYVPLVRPGGLVIMHDVGPTIHVDAGKRFVQVKHERPAQIRNCFAAWADLASKHSRKLLVQDGLGYGLVWIDE